ncbi:MAG: UDP-N-acetyl-D-mannosamine dehydrogenase [Flavobacteriales bacterium]|nr:UDP-N-acetyl-D-mannosamine dehydrogenase [Flavobacteriales bacterium]|tara:strand:- start:548 stop:1762 length:1215 start_codon:yes stop_codon:yes gene_type:complete
MIEQKVVVMGLGYIGLPTAALIASKGFTVRGVDIDQSIVDVVNAGKIHIVEPDLDQLVKNEVKKGSLKANIKPAESDIFIITVPTPFKDNNEPDLKYVNSAISMIIPFLQKGNLIIIESTSPVGTTMKVSEDIFRQRPELLDHIHITYCPERVLPGKILYELESNDRVIGGMDDISSKLARDFYAKFVKGELHLTNAKTAEMCKLVENSSRDVSISFANELSMICDQADINVWELIKLANKHPRVNILQPGTGVGGHCIAVDPWFLISAYKKDAKLIRNAREINNYKTEWVIEKIKKTISDFKKHKHEPTIAIMGLSFKPDIDDLRQSPALYVARKLYLEKKFNLLFVEPNIKEHEQFQLCDISQAINKSDILVYLVAHQQFLDIKFKNGITLDFCGVNQKNFN